MMTLIFDLNHHRNWRLRFVVLLIRSVNQRFSHINQKTNHKKEQLRELLPKTDYTDSLLV